MTNEEIIKRVNDTFAENNTEGFLSYCAEDIQWNMIGNPILSGKEAIRESMEAMEFDGLPTIEIDRIISQGDMVVVEGIVDINKKSGELYHAAFCDIYRLENEKIKEMNSYILELEPSHQ